MKRLICILIVLCGIYGYAQDLPCGGYELQSDEFYYRGSGSGVDADSLNARRKAIMIARQRIVTQVEAVVNSTTEIYIMTIATDMNAETMAYMRFQTETVANKLLVGSKVICEKTERRKDNQFESSVAMEIEAADIENIKIEGIDYPIDWEKYKEILHTQIIQE